MSWLMRESSRATREVSSNGIVRRMVNLPRSIVGGVSRVVSHGIGRIGIAGRRDQNPIPNFPLQPLQDPLNAPEEWTFLSVYEQQYGSTHPLFYACQFMEALKIAEDEHKFMFMYLHSPQHPFTPSFCWGTLGSELVVQFLDANFVCWGALSDRGEGSQMAVTLQPASFPCCAVIAPAAGNSIAVLQQMEGPISPGELVEILQRTVEEQGLAFGNSRAKEEETTREKAMEEERKRARAKEEEKIRADRQLREEQDAAYLSALKIDKEKEKLNSLLPERKFQKPAGSSSKANYEKLRQNPSQKQFGKSKEVSTVIETANGSKDSQATQKWREEFRVSELSEEAVKSIVDTGKAYVHDSLDVYGKPVLIVVASKHFPSEHDPVENEKLCVFLIEKALGKLVAGKEQILGIFDLRGFSTKNADLTYLTFLFDVFYYYYPKRLGQVLFVEAPFIFKPIWQVAKPLLRSNASLVRFCSVETVRNEYFTEETLPASFREKTI